MNVIHRARQFDWDSDTAVIIVDVVNHDIMSFSSYAEYHDHFNNLADDLESGRHQAFHCSKLLTPRAVNGLLDKLAPVAEVLCSEARPYRDSYGQEHFSITEGGAWDASRELTDIISEVEEDYAEDELMMLADYYWIGDREVPSMASFS